MQSQFPSMADHVKKGKNLPIKLLLYYDQKFQFSDQDDKSYDKFPTV